MVTIPHAMLTEVQPEWELDVFAVLPQMSTMLAETLYMQSQHNGRSLDEQLLGRIAEFDIREIVFIF